MSYNAVGYRTQRDGTTAAADESGPRNIDLSATDEERDKVNLKGMTGHKKHIKENTQYSCFMLFKYFSLTLFIVLWPKLKVITKTFFHFS